MNKLNMSLIAVLFFTNIAHAADASWETLSVDDGFTTQRKVVPGSDMFAFRGEMVTDVSIAELMTVFLDTDRRKDWVDKFESSSDLSADGEFSKTYYIRFNLPYPITDRDYVLSAVGKIDDANRVVTTLIKSVDHQKAPVDDCCVRANALGTFYRFAQLPNGKTKLEVEVHTDPKGSLPSWLVNIIQKSWPRKTLQALVREAKKAGIPKHATFAHWDAPTVNPTLIAKEPKVEPATASAEEASAAEPANDSSEAPAQAN